VEHEQAVQVKITVTEELASILIRVDGWPGVPFRAEIGF
jgi:hypothetical protein